MLAILSSASFHMTEKRKEEMEEKCLHIGLPWMLFVPACFAGVTKGEGLIAFCSVNGYSKGRALLVHGSQTHRRDRKGKRKVISCW